MILPNPNDFDYYRRSEPFVGLKAKVDNKTFEYYRRGEPLFPEVLASTIRGLSIFRAGMVIPVK